MTRTKIALPIVGSVAVVAVVVGVLWAMGSASGERDRFSSLEIAPAEADVFFAINTDPTSPQWLAVNDSLDKVNAKDPIREFIDEALAEVNLDWEDDITPIAGDEAFFSVPDIEDVSGGGGFVAGFRIRNTDRAGRVFEDLRGEAEDNGGEFEEEEYEGVTIFFTEPTDIGGIDPFGTSSENPFADDPYFECVGLDNDGVPIEEVAGMCVGFYGCSWYDMGTTEDDDDTDLDGNGSPDSCDATFDSQPSFGTEASISAGGAVALFDDVLALGGTPDDVKAVIDVVQGREESSETNERLQEFRALQKDDFLMWGYVDLAPVWDMADEALDNYAVDIETNGTRVVEPRPTPKPIATAPPPTDYEISSFAADYTIDAQGTLQVTERINVDFGAEAKHGIFRNFETRRVYDFQNDEIIEVRPASVTRDGVAEPFELNAIGETQQIKIGDPNVMMDGAHEYVIQYQVLGAIHQWTTGDDDAYYEITWDATGDWGVPIGAAELSLTVPSGLIYFGECVAADDPMSELPAFEDIGCTTMLEGDTAARFTTGELAAGEGFGFYVGVSGESGAPPPVLEPADNFPDFDDGFEGFDEEPLLPFDAEQLRDLADNARGAFDRVGFAISSHSNGFALDFTVLQEPGYAGDFDWEASDGFESHFASEVPDDTMFFFAGDDLYEQGFAQFQEQLDALDDEQRQAWDDVVETVSDEIGVDLEDDVLALLTGEIAFAGNLTDFGSGGPDVELRAMADVSDDADATDTLETIGEYLEDQAFIEIDEDDGVTRWVDAETGEIEVGWRVEDGRLVFGFPADAAEGARAGGGDSLADTDDWQRTLDLLPEESAFVGYLSIARILEEVAATNGEGDPIEDFTSGEISLDDLDAIRTAAFSATIRENGFGYHFVLFMED